MEIVEIRKARGKDKKVCKFSSKCRKGINFVARIVMIVAVFKMVYGNQITPEYIEYGLVETFGAFIVLVVVFRSVVFMLKGLDFKKTMSRVEKYFRMQFFFDVSNVMLLALWFTAVSVDYYNYGYLSLRDNNWWGLILGLNVLALMGIILEVIIRIVVGVNIFIAYRKRKNRFRDFCLIYEVLQSSDIESLNFEPELKRKKER